MNRTARRRLGEFAARAFGFFFLLFNVFNEASEIVPAFGKEFPASLMHFLDDGVFPDGSFPFHVAIIPTIPPECKYHNLNSTKAHEARSMISEFESVNVNPVW